jgi:hypothetical protein
VAINEGRKRRLTSITIYCVVVLVLGRIIVITTGKAAIQQRSVEAIAEALASAISGTTLRASISNLLPANDKFALMTTDIACRNPRLANIWA